MIRDKEWNKSQGIILSRQHLEITKKRILASDDSILAAWSAIQKKADNFLDQKPLSVTQKKTPPPSGDLHDYMSVGTYWWPDPSKKNGLPYIRRDGEINPAFKGSDVDRFFSLSAATLHLSVASFFSNDLKYAAKAAELLKTWFLDPSTKMNPHLRYAQHIPGLNDGRGLGIIDLKSIRQLLDGVILLPDEVWDDRCEASLVSWMKSYLKWLLQSDFGKGECARRNNHGTWYDAQTLSIALYVEDIPTARQIAERGKKRIAEQISPDGKQELELARSRPITCCMTNLQGLFDIASMAENIDIDLWNYEAPSGGTLERAAMWLVPYISGNAEYAIKDIKKPRPPAYTSLFNRAHNQYERVNFNIASFFNSEIPHFDSLIFPLLKASKTQQKEVNIEHHNGSPPAEENNKEITILTRDPKKTLTSDGHLPGPGVFMTKLMASAKRHSLADFTFSEKTNPKVVLDGTINISDDVEKRFSFEYVKSSNKPHILRLSGLGHKRVRQWYVAETARIIPLAHHVIYQTNYCKEAWTRALGETIINGTPSSIILNGDDPNRFQNCSDDFGSLPGFRFLAIASWGPAKRLDFTMKLFIYLLDKEYDVSLLVAGRFKDGETLPKIPERHASRIRFIGRIDQDQIPRFFNSGDAFIHLRKGDWCPNSVVEGICAGIPGVVHSVGGTIEIIGDAGVAVNNYDLAECEDAISTLIQNYPDFKHRALLRREFLSIDRIAEKYINVAKRVIQEESHKCKSITQTTPTAQENGEIGKGFNVKDPSKEAPIYDQYRNLHKDHKTQEGNRVNNGIKILSFIRSIYGFSSILDVGCGGGYWLAAAKEIGVHDIFGVEGHWLDKQTLFVDEECVLTHDLETEVDIGRKFDLVISIEVAEHISKDHASTFVGSLVRHGDVILFSAAIPGQGGVNHINEQWQSYWGNIFIDFGYLPVDLLRNRFWNDKEIFLAYRQNAILYVKAESQCELANFIVGDVSLLDVVHPKLYMQRHKQKLHKSPKHAEWKKY